MEIILNSLLLTFFPPLQLSNTRDVAVITAGGLFTNPTKRKDVDALIFLTSLKIMLMILRIITASQQTAYGIKNKLLNFSNEYSSFKNLKYLNEVSLTPLTDINYLSSVGIWDKKNIKQDFYYENINPYEIIIILVEEK